MRILIHTRFHPNIGGIETVSSLLAHQWTNEGQEVIVVSDVYCDPKNRKRFSFPVYYRPNPLKWINLVQWSQLYLQFNVSLKALWPVILIARPLAFSHQTFYWTSRDGDRDYLESLKLLIAGRFTNIHASQAIAEALAVSGTVIPNVYDDTLFHCSENSSRDRELVFVGRLVSDKGADLLLNAVGQLSVQGLHPVLTIIGDGPERASLEKLASSLGIANQVRFVGSKDQPQVADLLRQHDILVVPSLWQEPFGVVALEGAACGCVVVGSDEGGLPEAIGPTGQTFKRGDWADLACKLLHLLQHPELWGAYRNAAAEHLARHPPEIVAGKYLQVFRHAVERNP